MPESCSEVEVEVVGEPIAYADGFEADLLSLLERVSDRATGSAELADRIEDWPSLYHLSGARANILVPLDISPGQRVLECGAGTGVLTRWLVEQGADVVAVEGSLSRARCAATRLVGAGPGTARIVCADLARLGDIADLDQFDLILVIGVLEYCGRYGLDPEEFLRECRALLAPGGRVAIAIENQIGLKYLLGGQEDHLGLPWIGVEGYHEPSGIRTYSRTTLRLMCEAAGFASTEFLSVFPDYKFPSAILRDSLIESPCGPDLMAGLVREPVSYRDAPSERLCDARAAARVFGAAGLGAETSSSILCVASVREAGSEARTSREHLGWLFSACARRWDLQGVRVLAGAAADPDESGFELVRLPRGPGHVRMAWLEHEAPLRATVLMGACLEDIVLDALARHDALAAHAAVGAWHECLVAASHESDIETPPNPFCRAGRRLLLPPEYVDVGLSNFIIDDHGDHHYVDQEWHGTGGVEVDIVVMRALLLLGATLVHRGLEHPWSPLTTPEDIAMEFAAALGVSDPHEAARAALDAEEEFQLRVAAGPLFKRDAGALRRLASSRRGPFKLNWLRLRRDLTRSHEQLAAAVERVEELAARLEHLTSVAERQEDEIQLWRQRWARLERRWPMRIMRSLRRLMP